MVAPVPGLPMPLQLSAGGGGPGYATSNAGVGTPISNPFNFDGSGWVINFGNGNSTTASGNKDANSTTQTPSGQTAGGLLSGLGFDPKWLLLGAAAYLLMKR